MRIVGAGFAGLIAAHVWQRADIIEAQPAPRAMHRALLRFRTDVIGRLIGVEFKPVTVHKGIWDSEIGEFVAPNIRHANMYAMKCLGGLRGDRSIWNIETATRWVAPESLYEQLVETLGNRIAWGSVCDFKTRDEITINTAPLPLVCRALDIKLDKEPFDRAPITVMRIRIPKADVYQTVYFPTDLHPVYRASITGDLLIVEAMGETNLANEEWMEDVWTAFNLPEDLGVSGLIDTVHQSYGKIVPLTDQYRKQLLYTLTSMHEIYSLGRFATWRNLLLDDLPSDIEVIKRLITRSNHYDLSLAHT